MSVLCAHGSAGAPAGTVGELVTGIITGLAMLGMLIVVTPTTTAMYSLVTTVEGFMQPWAVKLVSERHGWLDDKGEPLKVWVKGLLG